MRILVFKSIDSSSDWLVECFKNLGHEAQLISEKASEDEIIASVESFRPDLSLFNNVEFFSTRADGDKMEELLNRKGIPIAIWYFEPPHWMGGLKNVQRWIDAKWNKSYLYFQIDSGYIDDYKAKGLTCYYLPFAANPAHANFQPNPAMVSQFQHDVAYIGQPWFKDIQSPLDGSAVSIQKFHEEFFIQDVARMRHFFLEGPGVSDFVGQAATQETPAIHHLFSQLYIDSAIYQKESRELIRDITSKMPAEISSVFSAFLEGRIDISYSVFRQAMLLSYLIDSADIHIYGGEEWLQLLSNYKRNPRYLTNEELYVAYHSAKIVIKDTKHIFRNVVHERVPHVLAVGGFPLVDYRADLSRMFSDDEIAIYHSTDELSEKIKFYLTHEDARKAMAAKGRARVLKDHTYLQRAQQIVDYAHSFFGI